MAAGVTDEVLVQIAYAIGVAQPVSLYVNTYGKSKVNKTDPEIAAVISNLFDLRPGAIIKRLGLKNPIFRATAAYGHFGRDYFKAKVKMGGGNGGQTYEKEVEFFAWEKLDYVDKIKKAFNL